MKPSNKDSVINVSSPYGLVLFHKAFFLERLSKRKSASFFLRIKSLKSNREVVKMKSNKNKMLGYHFRLAQTDLISPYYHLVLYIYQLFCLY